LAEALEVVPDPRKPYGWRPGADPLPLVALLQFVVAAMLGGARSLNAVAQWGRERLEDDPALLERLGLPPGRSPCVATVHRVLKALDVGAFEGALGDWLVGTGVTPDEPLAVDGKTLRGATRGVRGEGLPGEHLVSAYTHASGAVLGQVRTAGKGHELAGAAAVLATVPLAGRLVTADALLTQRHISQQIVAGGGDDLLPVDANQPALLADSQEAFSPVGPGHRARRARLAPSAVARA